ncbi:MAG: transketolase C-terminal domain-containing protein [Wenzhouxiangella sp.]
MKRPEPAGRGSARQINRAEVVDQAFLAHLDGLAAGTVTPRNADGIPDADLMALFDSQMISRQIDLMARVKRLENKVFYTIGSSGHEGNAMVGRLTRHTDPAFLHYRSGGFMAERYRKLDGMDFIGDTCLSFAASRSDPISGGRHKVWGSKPLWVLPQTSTIASHLPKAVGTALAIARRSSATKSLPVPDDSIVICSFGDASLNHATAQAALNTCAWTRHQNLPLPVLMVCEDNGIGISVPTPSRWVRDSIAGRHGLEYHYADGLDLAAGFGPVSEAVDHCRQRRRPVFLHLKTTRLMGHAGTDFEIEYRPQHELEAAEALDPLLRSAELVVVRGLMSPAVIQERYEQLRQLCLGQADIADGSARLTTLDEVIAPLAPYSNEAVEAEASRVASSEQRINAFGNERLLPENQPPRHLAVQINRALADLMVKYPEALLFGEDVARKGGVYTVTRGLWERFGRSRVFNTLLDETSILGLAQGFGAMGYLPIPEIQYLAYFHNACDQIRGEACSLQFFSNGQFRNPMVMRIASLGYQRGFGGHFHNDNSITALRDIPGLVIGCPSRGDDAVNMLRTMMSLARVDGRVCAFLEPIALYMTKDLYEKDDNQWCFAYPAPGESLAPWEPRVYAPEAADLLIISYGNGVPMALRSALKLGQECKINVRVMDLRWLKPLDTTTIARHAGECSAIVVFDEGRPDGGIGEAVLAALVDRGQGGKSIKRVTGADCYIPLGDAANLVLASEAMLLDACKNLVN